jgi:hypothetical protein
MGSVMRAAVRLEILRATDRVVQQKRSGTARGDKAHTKPLRVYRSLWHRSDGRAFADLWPPM